MCSLTTAPNVDIPSPGGVDSIGLGLNPNGNDFKPSRHGSLVEISAPFTLNPLWDWLVNIIISQMQWNL